MNSITKVSAWVATAVLFLITSRVFARPPQYDGELDFLETSANRGNSEAQHLLGIRYSLGDGVQLNPAAAERWWRVAAEDGFVPAMRELGEFYLLQGPDWVPVGKKWLVAAAKAGDAEATALLQSLASKGLLDDRSWSSVGSENPLGREPARVSTEPPGPGSLAQAARTGVAAGLSGDTASPEYGAGPRVIPAGAAGEGARVSPQSPGSMPPRPETSVAPPAGESLSAAWWIGGLVAVSLLALSAVWLGRRP